MSEEWRDELVTKGAVVDALKDNMFRLILAEEQRCEGHVVWDEDVVFADVLEKALLALPSAQPEIVRCKDCKHNPKETWFECPMSHLSEKQRPETAWCWKGERRTDA